MTTVLFIMFKMSLSVVFVVFVNFSMESKFVANENRGSTVEFGFRPVVHLNWAIDKHSFKVSNKNLGVHYYPMIS